jgi:hypothetical protein
MRGALDLRIAHLIRGNRYDLIAREEVEREIIRGRLRYSDLNNRHELACLAVVVLLVVLSVLTSLVVTADDIRGYRIEK